MTWRGGLAAVLAVALIPFVYLLGASWLGGFPSGSASGQAGAVAPPWIDVAADGQWLMAQVVCLASRYAGPSATPTWPAVHRGPPAALPVVLRAQLVWPVAVVAVSATWLVRLRHARWSAAMGRREPADGRADGFGAFWPEPTADSPLPPLTELPVPGSMARATRPPHPQGADLAARARLVALSFAFPQPSAPGAGPADWPLYMMCHPASFTLGLQHGVLRYRLEVRNRGIQPLGPLMIRADVVAADRRYGGTRPDEWPLQILPETLPLCHYLDRLPVGGVLELAGESGLPLAGIPALRLGTAELLVPLMRVCAQSTDPASAPPWVSAAFAIGLPPHVPGGGIQPFRLDTGPQTWRKLTARRIISPDLS